MLGALLKNIQKWISIELLKLSHFVYKSNSDFDLVWVGYTICLDSILPIDRTKIFSCSNYLDKITMERLRYHSKAGTLTEKKFNDIKGAWNGFLSERPNGTYYIPESGHYSLTLITEINTLFNHDFITFVEMLNMSEEPIASTPINFEQVANEPVTTTEVITEEPVAKEPVAEKPIAEEPVAEKPVIEEPLAEKPVAEEPVAEEPVANEPVAEEPVVVEPVAEELVVVEPVAAEPVAGEKEQSE
jgi:hypothetical protein